MRVGITSNLLAHSQKHTLTHTNPRYNDRNLLSHHCVGDQKKGLVDLDENTAGVGPDGNETDVQPLHNDD